MSTWRDLALCAQVDSDLFFPPPGSNSIVNQAKRICATCPVRDDCLTEALRAETGDWTRHGVWGGLTPDERQQLALQTAGTSRMRQTIDPDDLAFMVRTGVSLEDLARRMGVRHSSIVRSAQRHRIPLPDGWVALAQRLDGIREARTRSQRRTRADLPRIPRGQAIKRPDDCCPYCPTQRAAQPAEQLRWAMRGGPHCGRHECLRAHERVRYARRKAAV